MNTRRGFLTSLATAAPFLFLPKIIRPSWTDTVIWTPPKRYMVSFWQLGMDGYAHKKEVEISEAMLNELRNRTVFRVDDTISRSFIGWSAQDEWWSMGESFGGLWVAKPKEI